MTDGLLPEAPPDAAEAPIGGLSGFAAALRGSPRAFRILVAATAAFCLAMAIGEPYETIFVTERLGVSIAVVGLVWTVSSFVGLPLQFVGGVVCDRVGRRPLMVASGVTLVVFYLVMATAHSLWPVALVAVLESAIGWPLCLVACNAMIADLLPPGRRPVAYSVWRAAINVGMVVGPLVALALLAAGVDYRGLFVVASLGSALFVAAVVVAIPETKPAGAAAADGPETTFRRGLRVVLGDRRFVLFSAAAFLPLLCYGQFLWIFPVYLTDTLGLPAGSWAALLALNALVVVLVGPLFVHLTRGSDALWLMALGAALIGLGLGLTAFVSNLAAIVPLMMLLALGEALFWPISSAAVSEMAPAALRGTYMGAWTLVDSAGRGIGPLIGGLIMARVGGRENFAVVLVVSLVGAALFAALALRGRRGQRRPDAGLADGGVT